MADKPKKEKRQIARRPAGLVITPPSPRPLENDHPVLQIFGQQGDTQPALESAKPISSLAEIQPSQIQAKPETTSAEPQLSSISAKPETIPIQSDPEDQIDLGKINARADLSLAENQLSYPGLAENQPSLKQAEPTTSLAKKELSQYSAKPIAGQLTGYRSPNILDDDIMPTLPASEQIVLRRLFRLSYGFNRQVTDRVSINRLADKCNLSAATIKVALKSLSTRGMIKIVSDLSRDPAGGNQYEVLPQLKSSLAEFELSREPAKLEDSYIKDHDHDLKIHDHQSTHERETMTIYQQLTGNSWNKKDQSAYRQIKGVPLETIATVMKAVISRAPNPPGSLAYFVKEILDAANPSPAAWKTNRAQLQAIAERVRAACVGGSLPPSELEARVRAICDREGVVFDKLIFNEIAG